MQLEGQPAVEGRRTRTDRSSWCKTQAPRLWSAEHPNLYTLSVDLKDANGQVIEHVTKRIGIREVSIRNGILLVNKSR